MAETNVSLRETHTGIFSDAAHLPNGGETLHRVGRGTDERIVPPSVCAPLAAFGVYLTGLTVCADLGPQSVAGFRFVRPRARYGQVLACLGGEGRVWLGVGVGWATLSAGQAYLTPPDAFHAYEAVAGREWRLCWVLFDPAADAPDPTAALPGPRIVGADARPLAAAIDGLHHEAIGGPAAPAVLRLWAELVRAQAVRLCAGGAGMDARLRRVLAAVEARPDLPWSVGEMARRAGLSEEHLRRLCRDQLGRSPMRQVTHVRMRHAAALLSSGAYTVGVAAEKVGYRNDFAFSTAFKRVMGKPPSAYREGA